MSADILQHKLPDHIGMEFGGTSLDDIWLDSIHVGRTGLIEVNHDAFPTSPKETAKVHKRRSVVAGLHSVGMTTGEIGQALDIPFGTAHEDKEKVFEKLDVCGKNAGCLAVSQLIEQGLFTLRSSFGLPKELNAKDQQVLGGLARGLTDVELASEIGTTEYGVKHCLKDTARRLNVANRRQGLAFLGYAAGIVRPADNIPNERTLPFVETNPHGNAMRRNAYFPKNTWFELEDGQSLETGNVAAIHYRDSVIETRATTISAKWVMALAMNTVGISAAEMAQTLQGNTRAMEKRLARTYKTLDVSNLEYAKSGVAAIGKAFSEKHRIFSVAKEATTHTPVYPMTLARMHLLAQGENVRNSRIDMNRTRRDIINQIDKECTRQGVRGRDELTLWLFATGQLPLSDEKKAELHIKD